MTATARTATVTRTAKLRRAAVVSAAVLAMGAFAGCGGSDERGDKPDAGTPPAAEVRDAPSSFAADDASADSSTGTGWDSDYAEQAEQSFMEGCETTSEGNAAFCQCAFDEIKQTMTLTEVMRDGLAILDGKSPSRKFTDAVKSCVPAGADSGSPLNLS